LYWQEDKLLIPECRLGGGMVLKEKKKWNRECKQLYTPGPAAIFAKK
jgi:hypothetical protein